MEYKRIKRMKALTTGRKVFLLSALLLAGGMASAQVRIKGSVYGGGQGIRTDETTGLVTGDTWVTVNGGSVHHSIYGGGEFGSVGTFTLFDTVVYVHGGDTPNDTVFVPRTCTSGGTAKVIINGGRIGSFRHAKMPTPGSTTWEDSYGYIFAGGRGDADSVSYPKAVALAVVDSTYLEINSGAFITASVYGGCENGLLLGNSHMKIAGGQIGIGYWKDSNGVEHLDSTSFYQSNYETLWTTAINAIRTGDSTTIANSTVPFHECHAWPFGNDDDEYLVYDIFADSTGYNAQGGALYASDGNTFFGKVYGGGSGYYPFWDSVNTTAVWRRSAGRVNGNTLVEIEGGHILTAVFGGNELTDVVGTATVKMTGGTVGVPQLVNYIEQHPLNSHIFGAGLGDFRPRFNQWTTVDSTYVYITGGTVFGSVFGGGEVGRVLRNTCVTVKDSINDSNALVSSPLIGTWGYTTYEGNVFGSGRGFSGANLIAGSVGGNTEVNIEGGTMLGSVYGGGRLASVGSRLVASDDPNYGNLQEDDDDGTYGYTIVNIKGGTIGNRFEVESDDFGNYIGGNVFGGSKGRLILLDGTTNSRWEDMGKVKQTTVSINEADGKTIVIKGHVFGGGEIGRVEQNTLVDIDKGTIGYSYQSGTNRIRLGGDVYGGGMGLLTEEKAGLVKGNAYVDMSNGTVQRSLYGGGKFGSVGTFTQTTPVVYNAGQENQFTVNVPTDCQDETGLAQVVISGGQVGLTEALMPVPGSSAYDDDFGYVFCGGRGEADSLNYPKAVALAVVDSTYLEIRNTTNTNGTIRPLITASAYGGCENGLVLRDTRVKIAGGQIGVGYNSNGTFDTPYQESKWTEAINAIKGGTLTDALANQFNDCNAWPYGNNDNEYLVYDIFADQYDSQGGALSASDGNTFFGKVYGGGSGYYPIAPGVWRRSAGRVKGNTLVEIEGGHILTAVFGGNELTDVLGTATINMSGGTVGVPRTFQEITNTPTTCHMFGSGRGDMRTQFNTWTNVDSTYVYITGGVVFGSVFGGGEDGHVIRNTCVTVKDSIADGAVFSSPLIGTYGHTLFDGNVFGAGRGFSGDALTAGSVGGNTEVNIGGGQVLGSVYGGGRLASVGIEFLHPTNSNYGQLQNGTDHGYTTVNVTGGTIGAVVHDEDNIAIGDHRISGNVYGGSKGRLTKMDYATMNPRWPSLAKVKQTEVNISQAAGQTVIIKGDVFGGGEIGTVRDSTNVFVTAGTLNRDLFGGGYGNTSTATVTGCDSIGKTPVQIAGRVYGRTNATVNGGWVKHNVYGGGEYAKVGMDVNNVTKIRESTVSLNGGTIGDHVPSVLNQSIDTLFGGMVYGGGMGIVGDTMVAMVLGNTYIYDTLSTNDEQHHAYVMGHIHGGGEKALVQKNTNINLRSVEVGTLATATGTEEKLLPNGNTVELYDIRALEGGRVFGGGQGVEDSDYHTAALVMGNTFTEITGIAQINGSVYGGGELASVGSGRTQPDTNKNTGSTTVTISGGIIGPLNGSHFNGNVFGGGRGAEQLQGVQSDVYYATVDSTHVVIMEGADIRGSVFGGGANGRVLGNASIDIQGGTIGTTGLTTWDGNVFGGGRNFNYQGYTTGAVFGNTDIQMSGGIIKANMYGGGRYGSVGMDYNSNNIIDTIRGIDHGYVNINITGGVVGDEYVQYLGQYANGSDMPRTGFVFGGGRGILEENLIDKLGNVKGTTVTVGDHALVKSSVYGGSERGIVYKNTHVNITSNAVVGEASETMAIHRGDVFGGGCGLDTYTGTDNLQHYSHISGMVYGNTNVLVTGGSITRNVYGGGNIASVGDAAEVPVNGVYKTGLAKVTVVGGTIGFNPVETNLNGMVFGSGRGRAGEAYKDFAMVKNTEVVISGNAQVKGSVFGSGEDGHTRKRTNVLVGDNDEYTSNGLVIGVSGASGIDGNVYGGGRGYDTDDSGNYSSTAGIVGISTTTLINNGTVLGSVFGGGRMASVGYELALDTVTGGNVIVTNIPPDYGRATVTVTGSAIIGTSGDEIENGNVFGSGKGSMGTTYANLSYVNETEVLVNGNAKVYGSVFGGGEDGHVRDCNVKVNVHQGETGEMNHIKDGNTHVTIDGYAIIGDQAETSDPLKGNVYGGGRGLDKDHEGNTSPTAGVVEGNTKVDILNGTIWRSVFGGGNESVVKGQKVTNIVDGLIHADVHGGSNAIPVTSELWAHGGLKTVNIRGGHVMGDVYGCSHSSNDGELTQSQTNAEKWTSFVNISGGQIDEDVHGAGYTGLVNGSVCVNIGKDAILNAPNHEYNVNFNKPHTGMWNQTGIDPVPPTVSTLVIGGSVYGGSDYYGASTQPDWAHYDITGYSLIFIDGTDYNTTNTTGNYMNIGGGLFGSGTHTESGQLGRHILLKDYGTRNETSGEMRSATRTLTTIQRVNNLVIDHANVNLSGLADISNTANENVYGVMRVSDTLAVINASGIVLGVGEDAYAHMDSIYSVQSLKLVGNNASIYAHNLYELKKNTWYWLGIQDEQNDARLYYISGTGADAHVIGDPLTFAQENVVLYNDSSKLWVRYHEKKATDTEYKQYYGELLGFFRMRGDYYDPYDLSESFAYARPKYSDYTAIPELTEGNLSDGGWLSYNTEYNFFIDDGAQYTNSNQHPYLHPYLLAHAKNDVQEYRYWVAVRKGRRWYVDGTRGWGRDVLKSEDIEAGRYPNKPKKTLFGTVNNGVNNSGIVNEQYPYDKFSFQDGDIIYVVGALSAQDEMEIVRGDTLPGTNGHGINHKLPLKLFRYPGGHMMSNQMLDYGTGDYWVAEDSVTSPTPEMPMGSPWFPVPVMSHKGPGANYGAMVDVQANANLTMKDVVIDGLYKYTEADVTLHEIPTDTSTTLPAGCHKFKMDSITEPLIITRKMSTLTLGDSTVLMRGYNSADAAYWYTDAFYDTVALNLKNNNTDSIIAHKTKFRHGGAIYVDGSLDANGNDIGAKVNLTDTVYITGNKQFLRIDDTHTDTIECNVFLPTFHKHLYITRNLYDGTRIGVTSPRGNADPTYETNTFSPVAEGYGNETVGYYHQVALDAWTNNNFYDDLDWFFVNRHKLTNDPSTSRTTYCFYDETDASSLPYRAVYFGWTWANVVRIRPENGYVVSGNTISISSEYGLAWLISVVNGMNRQPASSLNGKTVSLATATTGTIKDIYDMKQYVWVPVGGQGNQSFAGTFDGKGHLITNLYVEFLGKGDRIYELNDYGMFGRVGGTVDRTFLVSGEIRPVHTIDIGSEETETYNIGGLVGTLEGNTATVSNSEAAMRIICTQKQNLNDVAGGSVGEMEAGEIHSSMAMPYIKTGTSSIVGGLVGSSKAGKINNSFVNATFNVDDATDTIGGLLGTNKSAVVRNCYVTLHDCVNLNGSNFGSIVNKTKNSDDVNHCYVMDDYAVGNGCGSRCGQFAPVISADMLGYMYDDNKVWINGESDTTMFLMLNRWVDNANLTNNIYARWARPGIREINGDLPVLLLDDDSPDDVTATDEFRSLATYNNGIVLQYGGTTRDDDQLVTMLGRSESVFVYGDVNEDLSLVNTINANKVSLYEHAAILNPGKLGASNSKADDYKEIYVGITFDNTHENGNGYSTPGINYGLVGMGGFLLPRDWHMFSTPLSHAPLGFNYYLYTSENDSINTNTVAYGGNDHGDYYNNIWEDLREFSWLNDGHTGNNRYWMKGWRNSQIGNQTFNQGAWEDGYFPSSLSTLHAFGTGCIPDATENGRYPYGMDFFTWTEPDYHWINFKRNGPNHWHSDANEATNHHDHIDYEPVSGAPLNVNEEELIIGRGYMAAISVPTFMQSHGTLNTGDQYIPLTYSGRYCTGWNLVGNPYHGYLDFDAFATDNANNNLLAKEGSNPFYVVYNADGYSGAPESAFIYYVNDGSAGGAYAGPYLHPHQGFFVQMNGSSTGNDTRLHFSDGGVSGGNNMVVPRDEVSGGTFRSRQPRYPLVNLFLSSDNGCNDVTVIEFERPEWGGATKLRELRQGDGLFYGYHDNHRYAALFAETGTTRVPLWFEAKEDDIFTMKWNTANADFSTLYLIDNITGVEYDMLANDTYTFEGHKQDYYARFYIVFSLTDVEEHVDEDIFAFFDGSQWVVTGKGELDFIDLQGRILYHDKLSGGQSRMRFPVVAKGMYLLRLVNSNETKVQKIIVK